MFRHMEQCARLRLVAVARALRAQSPRYGGSMIFNPQTYDPSAYDPETQRQLKALIEFFENKGLAEMKDEFHQRTWYQDFLDFNARKGSWRPSEPHPRSGQRSPLGHRPYQRPERDPGFYRWPTGTHGR